MPEILQSLVSNSCLYDGAVAIKDPAMQLTRAGVAARVAALAEELRGDTPRTLGLLGDNGVEWAVAQLAGWTAGKIMVPLPTFFSPAQLTHLCADAQLSHVVTTKAYAEQVRALGLKPILVSEARTDRPPAIAPGAGQIIYTSGSTGTPKGVRLGLDQIDHSARALAKATNAHKSDVFLSVLPLPLLLETICAICLPLLVGGRTIFEPALTRSIAAGSARTIADVFERHEPTSTVLVPQVLSQWVAELSATGRTAPAALRFVAVGGAPLANSTADAAWALGIPVHEGYGLSECCSVVTLNQPGKRIGGTVGQPIDGLEVRIEDGEIVVDGPTIMQGYLNRETATRPWRTGDLGHLDDSGNLIVEGRKDNLIVTSYGRNVSPEWIEAMLAADPRVMAVAVTGHGHANLAALIVPSVYGAGWFATASGDDIVGWINKVCLEAPTYAVPTVCMLVAPEVAARQGLFTSNGRIKRAIAVAMTETFRADTAAAV